MHLVDDRTFTQRFGKKCPFCGRNWSSYERCDPEPGALWKDTNKALYAKPVIPERSCATCLQPFTPTNYQSATCSDPCRRTRNRKLNTERSRLRNERRRAAGLPHR